MNYLSTLAFRKKVEAVAKKKSCEVAGLWMKSLSNHMYWCAASTKDGDENMIEAKWLSVINHIHNKHKGHGEPFPECAHGPIHSKKWIKFRKFTIQAHFEVYMLTL